MSETKIEVPEGMLGAAVSVLPKCHCDECIAVTRTVLEAALRWQRDNAPLPSVEFVAEFMKLGWSVPPLVLRDFGCRYARCMYDAPEPEIPEAIKELFWERKDEYPTEADRIATEGHNAGILEAFRRGQQAK
jgi:hypothetical protein